MEDLFGVLIYRDLLVTPGILDIQEYTRIATIAQKTGLAVDRVLKEEKTLPDMILQAAVSSRRMVNEYSLPLQMAIEAMKIVQTDGMPLDFALDKLGWQPQRSYIVRNLGQLLLDSGCLSQKEFLDALEICFSQGQPFSKVLILRKTIPESLLYSALTLEVLMRENKIDLQSAVQSMRTFRQVLSNTPDGEAPPKPPQQGTGDRLGELLLKSEIISVSDLIQALEIGYINHEPLGKVLLKEELITESLLKYVLATQHQVRHRSMEVNEAINLIRHARHLPEDITDPAQDEPAPFKPNITTREEVARMSMPELLALAGIDISADPVSAVRELVLMQQNLTFRVVSEHEEVKNMLARELHDSVIADLMMLRRYLSGDRKLSIDETIEIIDDVVHQLRDICSEFTPKTLKEWGLRTSLQDLSDHLKQRSGIKCQLVCPPDIPRLPDAVELHIFRIVQECINNVQKYSGASEVYIDVEMHDNNMRLMVTDNGRGFDTEAKNEQRDTLTGGMGLAGMNQRLMLLRCFFPATLIVESRPGVGTRVVLDMTIKGGAVGDLRR